jgi:hypothetical protein
MNDDVKIYQLYVENAAANEQPQMKVNKYGVKEWRLHGIKHREDGPAMESANGDKFWYHHGALHREDGPAIENANGGKQWLLHGIMHREDGPAVEYADGNKAWWLHGKEYANAAAWAKAVLKQKNEPHDEEAVQQFVRMILTKDDLI